jgi:hypothetical protein
MLFTSAVRFIQILYLLFELFIMGLVTFFMSAF